MTLNRILALTIMASGTLSGPAEAVNLPEPSDWAFAQQNATPSSELFLRAVAADGQKPAWQFTPTTALIKNRTALVQLGKALFWDVNVGGDGNACASCHFMAGADNRIENAVSPGLNHRVAADPMAAEHPQSTTFQALPGGSNPGAGGFLSTANFPLRTFDEQSFVNVAIPQLQLPAGFVEGRGNLNTPFHVLATPGRRPDPSRVSIVDDVVSSQGTFTGDFHVGAAEGSPWCTQNALSGAIDAVFSSSNAGASLFVRKVEPRNTPTVIGACRNKKNFWDGRAKNVFNGVNPNGLADPDARVRWWNGSQMSDKQLAMTWQSCASQAVGPVLSTFEMTCSGQSFPDVGRKLLGFPALRNQMVSKTDSVLGPLINRSGAGLARTYRQMVQAAFQPAVWDGPAGSDGFTTDEANFALLFGLAVAAYEETLTPDATPFDKTPRHAAPSPTTALVALSNPQKPGFLQRKTNGRALTLPVFSPAFDLLEGQCYNRQRVRDVNGQFLILSGTCVAGAGQQVVVVPDGVVLGTIGVNVPGDILGWTAQETQGMDLFMGNFSIRNLPTAVNAMPLVPTVSRLNCRAPNQWDTASGTCVNALVTVYDPARNTCSEQVNAVAAKTGGCIACHMNAEFTSAAVSAVKTAPPVVLPANAQCPPAQLPIPVVADVMPMLNSLIQGSPVITAQNPAPQPVATQNLSFAVYDIGFYNVGVTPTEHDIGAGARDVSGQPLSFSEQLWNGLSNQMQPAGALPDPLAEASLVDFLGGFSDPLLGCGSPLDLNQNATAPQTLCQLDPTVVTTAMRGAFKTPTLRNVALTPPYFHNGGALALRDVVHHYNLGCLFWQNDTLHPECIPRLLTTAEEDAIAAFIAAKLTDPRVALRKKPFDGPALPVLDGYQRDASGRPVLNRATGFNLAADKITTLPETGAAGQLTAMPTTTERLSAGRNAAGQ